MPGYWNVPETGQTEKKEPARWTSGGGDQGRDDGGGGGGRHAQLQREQEQARLDRIQAEAQKRHIEQQKIDARNAAAKKMESAKRAQDLGSALKSSGINLSEFNRMTV